MEEVRVEFFMEMFSLNHDITSGIIAKLEKEGIIMRSEGQDNFRVDRRTLEMVALPKYLGVKKTEERKMECILEKTGELEIGNDCKEKAIKRQREMEIGNDCKEKALKRQR